MQQEAFWFVLDGDRIEVFFTEESALKKYPHQSAIKVDPDRVIEILITLQRKIHNEWCHKDMLK